MSEDNTVYWKRLWRWITTQNLSEIEISGILNKREVANGLLEGLASYKPLNLEEFNKLQAKYPDQTKLLYVVQTLQYFMNVDSWQVWDMVKYYLSYASYGTPASSLKNVAFVDTRPTFLVPTIWRFYYSERLFCLKTLQYIIEYKSDSAQKYHKHFETIVKTIGIQALKTSLINQFENLLSLTPPSRKIHTEFGIDTVRQEWAESNLREQLAILQTLLLIVEDDKASENELKILVQLFRKHNYGKNQAFNELLEGRHKEACSKIMFTEICLFMVIVDNTKIPNISSWIEGTKEVVEYEFNKLRWNVEHSPMLVTWMMIMLQSEHHKKYFDSHYQHYGATALRMKVFHILHQMLNNPVFCDDSKCTVIARQRIFRLMNDLCDKFDGDGTISNQPGVMQLCSELLKSPEMAEQFWCWYKKDENFGIISLWNTALEYFPHNFHSLSILAAGLAEAGKSSVNNLIAELKKLPVFTEMYNQDAVQLVGVETDDVVIGRDYYPLGDPSYRVEAGSRAAVIENKEGTMIHFRTPYSYWTVFISDIEKCLDLNQQHDLTDILVRVQAGTKLLKCILRSFAVDREIPKNLVCPSEGVFDILVRFMKTEIPPLPLMTECLSVCSALIPIFPKEIHVRLVNTGLLPRLTPQLSYIDYASGLSFDSASVGSCLVNIEQQTGTYHFLEAYLDMIIDFYERSNEERVISEIVLPGIVFLLRDVFPNVCGWRYSSTAQHRRLVERCTVLVALVLLQDKEPNESIDLVKNTCTYSLMHTENAVELLKIVSVGSDRLERMMQDETNWVSGSGMRYTDAVQRCLAAVMCVLREKRPLAAPADATPLEHLIIAPNKQKDELRVVSNITSYINNVFNAKLPLLSCRLLNKFAEVFQMSLFASLDMPAYKVRVLFLDRLRDEYETLDIKIAILEFVETCISTQPGVTEAFFMMNYEKAKADGNYMETIEKMPGNDDSFEGILGFMADYLGTIKSNPKLLHSPLLASVMALFHELWKNNMQALVKKLQENSKFWDHLTSPLFHEIQPELRTYVQIFNVLGMQLFVSREKSDSEFVDVLKQFFDINNKYLAQWISHIFSFKGRNDYVDDSDKVPVWLGLLTSWKDFTTVFCKFLPFNLNIAHKALIVEPCLSSLLKELEEMKDGRLVVILAEMYVIMLANWKDDCFENRKTSAQQIDRLLTNTSIVYEYLHPRAIRALLSIGTVAISSLDYEIKANSIITQGIIRSVTNIISSELGKLLDKIGKENKIEVKPNRHRREDMPLIVLSLAMLEQCLDLYDAFAGLSQWLQSTKFVNKLLCCLQACIQDRRHYHTCLATLRCLTSYARGPFSNDLLLSDVDQYLWLQLLPPKINKSNTNVHDFTTWKLQEWWKMYCYGLDFISTMVMKHGQFFASDAITFVGVHLDHLVEAVMMPRHLYTIDALNLCASTLNLIVQLVKFQARWRIQNMNSLFGIMRSISACLYECVTIMLRSRKSCDPTQQAAEETIVQTPELLHRVLEILHMATLCLLFFSPDLLSLLAEPALDLEHWQPLVELHFGAPKISHEPYPQLTFGTLLTAVCLLTRSLNHAQHLEEHSGSRSPHGGNNANGGGGRQRMCSCSSPSTPGERRAGRSESLASITSASAMPAPNERLVAGVLEVTLTLLASQALLTVRDPNVPARNKQLVRRELTSELTVFHDMVRKRVLCGGQARSHLIRNKLGAWPLAADATETKRIDEVKMEKNPNVFDDDNMELPPPPPPKRASQDSMREYILRKHYLDKCAQTPTKDPPTPVSHSTPTSDKRKENSRSSKRVSWAETTRESDEGCDSTFQEIGPVYSNLTDVQINNDEDYFHFMSVVFICICQTEL